MKRCSTCGVLRPLGDFHRNSRKKDGLRSDCRVCALERSRRYEAARRDPAENRRRLLAKYGMTSESFNALLAEQDGCCAACGTDHPGRGGQWNIDHDHACCAGYGSCGFCVRGLLCHGCNLALGQVDDDIDRLHALISYLLRSAKGVA